MLRFHSILWRIIVLHVLALTAASIAVPLASYLLLNATTTSFENRTLRAHADTIASYLSSRGPGQWTLALPGDLRTFYLHGFDGFAYSVVDRAGRVEYTSLRNGTPILQGDPRAPAALYFNRRNGKAIYYGASIPERRGAQTVWIEVAQDLEHPDVIIDDIVADFLRRVAWFTIPIMLVLLAADIYIVRRALRPLVRASEMAGAIDPANLTRRLPTRDIPREVLPLVHAVNRALDRLENGFRTLRDFTSDAAHELRTPLSVLRLRIDAVVAPDAAALLHKDIDAMGHVVDQLFAVAELEGIVVGPNETADLVSVCADVVALLAPVALALGKDIALTGTQNPVRVAGNAAMLQQAVRNLAENGLSYAPAGTTVEIDVADTGVVRVLDEGPGIAESERALIFQRFWRRNRSRPASVGLGLAIVRRIVDAHGGTVDVVARSPHGAVFSIVLRVLPSA